MISFKMDILLILCATYWIVASQATPLDDPDVGLNTVQMIENHGYPSETHTIITEDGYILTYHRIPHGINNTSTKKPAVLLMHGFGASSADYVNMGPNRSLAFILADNGYDVWIGNSRGNAWSRNHTTLDVVTDAEQFFDFSWHEVGYYDVAAAIDHILQVTDLDGLFYVGHSIGSTAFLALASTRPEYNSKIKLASLMAPASFMEHVTNELLLMMGPNIYEIEALAKELKMYEVPFTEVIRSVAVALCSQHDVYPMCADFIFSIIGPDETELDEEKIAVLFTNLPSNGALKPNYHSGQLIKNGGFSQYDYGQEKNLEIYGTESPPSYDLSKISAPVAIYYGKNDGVVSTEDVETLVSNLPNVVENYLVPFDSFNHLDFTYAIDVVELLYGELIDVMKQY